MKKMKYSYFLAFDDENDAIEVCIVMKDDGCNEYLKPLGKIVHASKYSQQEKDRFINILIHGFEDTVEEDENGHIILPEYKEWEIEEWI